LNVGHQFALNILIESHQTADKVVFVIAVDRGAENELNQTGDFFYVSCGNFVGFRRVDIDKRNFKNKLSKFKK
jgi:hypothetical protein